MHEVFGISYVCACVFRPQPLELSVCYYGRDYEKPDKVVNLCNQEWAKDSSNVQVTGPIYCVSPDHQTRDGMVISRHARSPTKMAQKKTKGAEATKGCAPSHSPPAATNCDNSDTDESLPDYKITGGS